MKAKDSSKEDYIDKALGWGGALLVILGYYLNANKIDSCWVIWIIGNAGMGIYCFRKEAYPAAFMSFVIMVMNVYGLLKWVS